MFGTILYPKDLIPGHPGSSPSECLVATRKTKGIFDKGTLIMTPWVTASIEFLFATSLFVNALLFIPQAWRIFRKKESSEVSLITFGGFWLAQLLMVLHALIKHDWLLFSGFAFALMTCGSVIVMTLRYR